MQASSDIYNSLTLFLNQHVLKTIGPLIKPLSCNVRTHCKSVSCMNSPKGIVHTKVKIQSSFTHPGGVLMLYAIRRNFKKCPVHAHSYECINQHQWFVFYYYYYYYFRLIQSQREIMPKHSPKVSAYFVHCWISLIVNDSYVGTRAATTNQ